LFSASVPLHVYHDPPLEPASCPLAVGAVRSGPLAESWVGHVYLSGNLEPLPQP
jgi:hypothetical protein